MRNKKWVEIRKGADFEEISKKYHISPVIARVIRNRNIIGDKAIEEYLYGDLSLFGDGSLLKDVDRAVKILGEKIAEGKKIRVIGDYDADGICASYVLQKSLQRVGAQVSVDIPHRVRDGYGLSMRLIEQACEDGIDTVITCDNGIGASESVAYGKEKGMTVIVTDHHPIPYDLVAGEKRYYIPKGDAVIDPNQSDCGYPFKDLCGAAVAYKVMEQLYLSLGESLEKLEDLLEVVGFATIEDIVNLVGENRLLAKEGLEQLHHTKNLGLEALMEVTGLTQEAVTAGQVGFVLGPCINASGRLESAMESLDLLNAGTRQEATCLAQRLKQINDNRKEMSERAVEQAIAQIEGSGRKEDKVYVVYLPDCHESLAGIVASRIRELYYRPAIVLGKGEHAVKGSGRSIETYDLVAGLAECSSLLLTKGGHKMAAGVSLKEENVDAFRDMINANARLTKDELVERLRIDAKLPFRMVTQELVEELHILEPFGKGNAKPVFATTNVMVDTVNVYGASRNVLKVCVRDEEGVQMEAVAFQDIEELNGELLLAKTNRIRGVIAYFPKINEFNGKRTVQLQLEGCLFSN